MGGFIPADRVRGLVEKGSLNFLYSGNGFFGYFFSDSSPDDPNRDSPREISEPGNSLAWWSTYAADVCPNPETLDIEDVNRQLRDRHRHWGDPVIQQILDSLHVSTVYPTWTLPELPTWQRDGVVLVGDAAHALPTTSGQGSSQAMEDSEAFALLLSHYCARRAREEPESSSKPEMQWKRIISQASGKYMEIRRPRVQGLLEQARKLQSKKRHMGVVAEYAMYATMWLMGECVAILAICAQVC